MYLRKSRMDTDFDDVSVEETLNRHRHILEAFCKGAPFECCRDFGRSGFW